MLKIRNLIFALSLTPLMSFAWQLPSLAQVGPSKGPAGTPSGAQTGGTTTTIFSAPPTATTGATTGATTTTTTVGGQTTPAVTTAATTTTGSSVIIPIIAGVSATVTSGVSTSGATSAATTTTGDTNPTVAVTAATVEPTSPSVDVTGGGTTPLVISLSPQAQVVVNQAGAAIVQNLNSATTGGGTTGGGTAAGGTTGGGTAAGDTTGGGTTGGDTTGGATGADIGTILTGGAGSEQAAATVGNSISADGVASNLSTGLTSSLTGLFSNTSASLPNQPVAITTSGQLVASTKAFKPVIIAQGSAGISVNINKLNDAIVAYNAIVLQSKSEVVKNLSKNSGFRAIGSILKQLRTVIK